MIYSCYLVVHPITKVPLYAGMSSNIERRTKSHKAPNSQVRQKIRSYEGIDLIPDIQIVAQFSSKEEATEYEIKLIRETPGIINHQHTSSGYGRYHARRAMHKLGRPLNDEKDKTLAATKPWETCIPKMSRSTWFRRQAEKRAETAKNGG